MVWPGLVHLRGLEMRVQSANLQWWLRLDQADTALRLFRLTDRHFQTKWFKGRGLAFRVRRRLSLPDINRLRFMPPIPGLTNPPDPNPEILYPASTMKPPWLIDLSKVEITGIKQIWIDRYRFTGDGQITGSMVLRVRGPLVVDNVRLVLDSQATSGGTIIARQLKLDINATVKRYVPRFELGIGALRYISGRFQVNAESVDLTSLEQTFNRTAWFGLAGQGRLSADLQLDRGRLLPGSRLLIDSPKLQARFIDFVASGGGLVRLQVDRHQGKPLARLAVVLDRFDLTRRPRSEPHLRGRDFKITAITHDLDLSHAPYTRLDITLDIPESEVTDINVYNRYLPAGTGFLIESGRGRVRTHLEASGKDLATSGYIDVRIEDMVSRFNDTEIKGDLRLHTKLSKGNIKTREFSFSGTRLELTKARVIGQRSSSKDNWWGNIVVNKGKLTFTSPLKLRAALTMKLRDSGPVIAIFAEKKSYPKWIKKVLTVRNIKARAHLVAGDSKVAIHDIAMSGRKLAMLAELRLARAQHSGLFYIRFHALSMALELKQGKKTWTMVRPRKWFNDRKRKYGRPGTK